MAGARVTGESVLGSLHDGNRPWEEFFAWSQFALDLAMVPREFGPGEEALIYLSHHANGSAALMRGKSRTCRHLAHLVQAVFDRGGSKTR